MEHKIIQVGFLGTNCHLLYCPDTKSLNIIDPGANPGLIIETASDWQFESVRIMLTHGHMDHIGAVPALAKHFGLETVELSPLDIDIYNGSMNPFFLPKVKNLPPTQDFQEIPECRILRLPGHTPGGVGFLFENKGKPFLISGDTIFDGSIGRTDLPGGDTRTLLESIRSRILPLPPEVVIFPGHGPATTVSEAHRNPYLF